MATTPTPNIDYTNKDYEAFRNFMLTQLGVKMPEYTDRSQTDAGIVILELLAKGLDIISFYQDVQANEAFLSTAERRANALKWCSMLDYTPRSSTPSKVKQVFVLSSTRPSSVYIPAGTRVKTAETTTEYSVMFETSESLEIPAGSLGNEQDGEGNYLYSVEAVQGYTVSNEILGSSNGTADQKFTLGYAPVIKESIALLVNEGNGFEPWTEVDNFLDSESTSKHYKVVMTDDDEAVIVFGNGITGKIPAVYANGIMTTYRVGGGSQGNVGANKITLLDSNIAEVDSTFNPAVPFEEGYDKETLQEIKINAPNAYRNKWSCLVETDYADRVKELFPQIVLASSQKSTVPGRVDDVNVYVLHNTYPAEFPAALMTEMTEMFEDRALVGTFANIIVPNSQTFVSLNGLSITIVMHEKFSRSSTRTGINTMLSNYFAIGHYDFAKECSVTDIESMIKENFDGIKSVRVSFENCTEAQDILSEDGFVITPLIYQILTLDTAEIDYNITGGIA